MTFKCSLLWRSSSCIVIMFLIICNIVENDFVILEISIEDSGWSGKACFIFSFKILKDSSFLVATMDLFLDSPYPLKIFKSVNVRTS